VIWAAKSSGLYNERFWIPIHTRGCPTLVEARLGGKDSGSITPYFVQYWIPATEQNVVHDLDVVLHRAHPVRPKRWRGQDHLRERAAKPGDAYRFLGLLDLAEQSETASPEFGDSNFLHDRNDSK
jgi:hypothetical protein